ncbi:hypothetical protein K1719_011060 [Acacia pycnantha]|nr:hypothetical protein K1719_011060 [Acacia pycnantha]
MLSADFPEEIMKEILTRLPVKSLIRSKSVAKSWSEQIANPSFIARQFELYDSVTGNSRLRLIFRWHEKPCISLISDQEPIDVEVPFPEKDDVSFILVYGQCNGIFCLYAVYGDKARRFSLILWNPGTREVKVLPASHDHSKENICGFGIDPVTKDYKVVRVGSLIFEGRENPPVEVYNLSTDYWRTVDTVVPAYELGFPNCRAYLNGFYHWIIVDNNDRGILFFDFSKELFGRIKLPPEINHVLDSIVVVIDKKLACVVAPYNFFCRGFDIWVMNEYGVESSWSKKFFVAPLCLLNGILLGLWGDDEILVDNRAPFVLNTALAPVMGLPLNPKAAAKAEKILSRSLATLEKVWLNGNGSFLLGSFKPSIVVLSPVCEIMQLEVNG